MLRRIEIDDILPKYSEAEIEKFDSDDKFMDAYVELLKQTIELIYRVVGLKYCDINGVPKKIDKDGTVVVNSKSRKMNDEVRKTG